MNQATTILTCSEAEKSWRRIRGVERIAEPMGGVVFKDGEPVKEQEQEQQRLAA